MAALKVRVRKMARSDVKAAASIERKVTKARGTGLERNLRARLAGSSDSICLAADVGGSMAGFLVAEVRRVEFGERDPVGWIEVVGVDPAHQGHGVGAALGREALRRLKAKRVRRVKTLVEWDAGDMVSYFASLGFRRADGVLLEAAV
jgi:GNAT superfamily N-acetyltransferase